MKIHCEVLLDHIEIRIYNNLIRMDNTIDIAINALSLFKREHIWHICNYPNLNTPSIF